MTRHNSVSSVGSNQFDMLRHSTASVSCSPPLNVAAAVGAPIQMLPPAVGGVGGGGGVVGGVGGISVSGILPRTGEASTQTDEYGPPMSLDLTVSIFC